MWSKMFKTVIGLEIHVQLKTKSKMFCSCNNNAEEAKPNTLTCPVCLGMPGTLPVANKQAIEWIVKTGLALNCQIAEFSKFDRKHYFYPDLPKGYQISQYDLPFCVGGFLEIETPEGRRKINLTRIHLEEDAGKLMHVSQDSLVDLNRAGTPLMEIVTEPEISSPMEAKIFLQELRLMMRYLGVSDADMEKGHLRCDANISISGKPKAESGKPDIRELGTPVEIKNLNSFRMVERALLYEQKRQIELIEKGEKIVKETRGWDDARGITISQRSKEQAQDYRYFPEPDLPPFKLAKFIDLKQIKDSLPELPEAKRMRYVNQYSISLADAEILTLDEALSAYFEKVASKVSPKLAANWVINELKLDGIMVISPERLIEMLQAVESNEISGKIAKDILPEMISTGKSALEIIKEKGLVQIGDETQLAEIVKKVLAENIKVAEEVKQGKVQAIGFLVGQVMRETRGQANPEIVNRLIKENLSL